jgi:hypothetical protein
MGHVPDVEETKSHGRKIGKCILNKQWVWLGGSEEGPVVGSCEEGNK